MIIDIIVKFKKRTAKVDTDLQCAQNAIDNIVIEIDTTKYSDLKYSMKEKEIYQYPLNSKEFLSTILSSDLTENIDSIETEVIIEDG